MSANAANWYRAGLDHIWLPYTQMKTALPPVPVRETRGTRIILEDGRELVDGVASWWTAIHGYNHPKILSAVHEQLDRMPHVMLGGLAHEPAYALAARLAEMLPGTLSRTFFSESGSVSVEVAMKIAVQYWLNRGETGRTRFVSFEGGYHGDTFATMSVCDPEEGMHTMFGGVVPAQIICPLPEDDEGFERLQALLHERRHEIAGVLVEPLIQGAGGMRMHGPETLRRLRAACAETGALLLFDEIFTGLGRTGTLFACEAAGVVPDIITLSKALTGGVAPLAATIAAEHVFDAFWSDDGEACLMHGPTYSGHALGCAAALASLDLFATEPRLQQVLDIERWLIQGLTPLAGRPGIADVRVMGAVGVVEFADPIDHDWLKRRFLELGVWIRPFRNIVYTTPAYVMEEGEIRMLSDAMVQVSMAWLEARRR